MTISPNGPLRVGIGGPVGTGKTALMDALCKHLRDRYDIAAITNDIYTKEDAEFLTRAGSLPPERILGIETGGCPHTAIREDASINLAGVADLRRRFPELDLILIESGGDNLAATFSPELADLTIYVIDVSAGDKIPRKGGPGITRSDLLVINKIDLAPFVGASLEVMDRDARKMRGDRPFVFANIRAGKGVAEIAAFIEKQGGLRNRLGAAAPASSRNHVVRPPSDVTQHLSNHRRQLVLLIRLGQSRQAGILAVRQIGIAGRQNDRQVRPILLDLPRKFGAGHARHRLVGDDQIDHPAPRATSPARARRRSPRFTSVSQDPPASPPSPHRSADRRPPPGCGSTSRSAGAHRRRANRFDRRSFRGRQPQLHRSCRGRHG